MFVAQRNALGFAAPRFSPSPHLRTQPLQLPLICQGHKTFQGHDPDFIRVHEM